MRKGSDEWSVNGVLSDLTAYFLALYICVLMGCCSLAT